MNYCMARDYSGGCCQKKAARTGLSTAGNLVHGGSVFPREMVAPLESIAEIPLGLQRSAVVKRLANPLEKER